MDKTENSWDDTFCNFCGAAVSTVVNWMSSNPTFDFVCGTEQLPGGFVRSDKCYEAQLAQQADQIASLKLSLKGFEGHHNALVKAMTPAEYLKLPYTFCLIWDEESKTWTGTVQEFPGCIAQSEYIDEILMSIREAARDWVAAALELGQEIPEPILEKKP